MFEMSENESRCLQCKRIPEGPSGRLVQDACGHRKCRLCLLGDELRCMLCEEEQRPAKKELVSHTSVITCQGNDCDKSEKSSGEVKKQKSARVKRNYNNLVIPSHVTVMDSNRFSCTICDKSFTSKYHIKYHVYCNGDKKPFQCETCRREFILKAHLETHVLTHQQNRLPYECDKCSKKFLEKSKLTRHKFVHSTSPQFTCSDCAKCFKNRENLRTHRLTHRTEKPYGCGQCKARFSHSSNLKKHVLIHSADKSHMCDQCGKRFKLKWALTVHRRGHLKIRPNECRICNKAFVHAKDLQRHEVIHLDTKGFTCGICGTGFKRKDNLNRHTKNTHPGKKPVIIRNAVKRKPQTDVVVDNPNAINVIKAPPTFSKEISEDKKEASVVSFMNVPLKLAFKTPAFKNNYNIHRDYVEPKELNPVEPVNIYEKILLPSPLGNSRPICNDRPVIKPPLVPFNAPSHYETSFDNKKHAVIKNIKFKLPANYTKLRSHDKLIDPVQALAARDVVTTSEDGGKLYTELKSVPCVNTATAASVIVNSSGNNYYDLHWRRRTAQYLTSRERYEL